MNQSPVMNLNIDVVREIFLACSFPPARIPLRSPAPRSRRPEPRLALTHVCSSWRNIALCTPELWCDIEIGLLRHRDLQCLETWLERSGQSPLSIYEQPSRHSRPFNAFDDVVLPNFYRCRRLALQPGPETLPTLLRLPPGCLYSLVEIKLDLSRCKSGTWIQEIASRAPVTAFQMAHQLRRVELRGSGLNKAMTDLWCLQLPWAQLTALAFEGIEVPVDIGIAVLRVCVALRSCTMSLSSVDHSHILPGAPVVLPALHTLHLKFHPTYAFIVAMFHLPALRTLHLETTDAWQWPVEALTPILAPAARTLESLYVGYKPHRIYDAPAPGRDPRELLELLPNLVEFYVQTTPRWPRRTLHDLRDGILGPRLKGMYIGEITARELLDLIEGRLRAARASAGTVSVITQVNAGCNSPRRENPDFGRLWALKKAGVTLQFDWDSLYSSDA